MIHRDNHDEDWPIDGKDHKNVSYNSLYENDAISTLFKTDRSILIASKGMGKTLLLRSKKFDLESSVSGHNIIPRNQEADIPQLMGTYSHDGLESIELWRDLWTISIILSSLSHLEDEFQHSQTEPFWEYIDLLDLNENSKKSIIEYVVGEALMIPSSFLIEFLSIGTKQIQQLRKSAHILEVLSRHYIRNSTCIFIDAFDQTLTDQFPGNLEIWKNAQIGLMHAIYKIKCTNKHIKTYASIRREAWSAFKADDRQAIKGSSIFLEYDKNKLRDLLTFAIRKYTNYSTIESLTGLEKIDHTWHTESEEIFDYIFRHCIGSPRSIMAIGSIICKSEINKKDKHLRMDKLRYLVNEAGQEQVYKDYLISQRMFFMETLSTEERLNDFISLLPTNAILGKSLITIEQDFKNKYNINENLPSPTLELVNAGVIGEVYSDSVSRKTSQKFKSPDDYDWNKKLDVFKTRTYLLHPSLNSLVSNTREHPFFLNVKNIIGNHRNWHTTKEPSNWPMIFISHSSSDKEIVLKITNLLEKKLDLICPSSIWIDKNSVRPGEHFPKLIEKGVFESDFVLLFVTQTSLSSGWVEKEWMDKQIQEIEDKRVRLICCFVDETEITRLPKALRSKSAVDLQPNSAEFENEIDSLANKLRDYFHDYWIGQPS